MRTQLTPSRGLVKWRSRALATAAVLISASLVALMSLVWKPSYAAAQPAEPEGVYFYEHAGWAGVSFRLLEMKVEDFQAWGFNDKLSSIRVVGPYTVTLFEHADLLGHRTSYYEGQVCRNLGRQTESYVGGVAGPAAPCSSTKQRTGVLGNDQASSVVVTRNPNVHPWKSILTYPSGAWVAGTSNSAHRWIFCADGRYQHRLVSADASYEIFGSYHLVGIPAINPLRRAALTTDGTE